MKVYEEQKKFKKIDAHSHIGYFGGWCDVGITPEEMIEQMDAYNIEKTVISTFPVDESIKAVDKYPDRLIGAAWVDPESEEAESQIRDAVENHGFKAIKLHPLFQAFRPNDECGYRIAELARELGVPVMVHTGHPPYSLPWSVAELAEDFPDVKFCLIHMGHGNGIYIQSAVDMAKKHPNLYLETSGMPMHTKIRDAYENVGSDRIMFGMDLPFHHPSVEIQKGLVSGLDDAALENYYYNNAKKFLGL
ncbi:MAG: amidohydrolase family protein [Anaerovoracaceae bacterium]|jgi:predicted TIM-barrel fold metal-dependent hydrolase